MYESVDVVGFSPSPSSPSPGSFLSMDYYHRPPGLGPDKGLLSGVAGLQRPFGGSLVSGRHWSGSSHCEYTVDNTGLFNALSKTTVRQKQSERMGFELSRNDKRLLSA